MAHIAWHVAGKTTTFLGGIMKSFRLLALTAAVLLSFAVAAVAAPVCSKKVNSFDFVVDYSGSMMMKNDKMKQDKI